MTILPWLGAIKQTVLVFFATFFAAVVGWAYSRPFTDVGHLPLDEE